ncbi:hypothetical protein [Pedobacter flavus]|uniref:Lipocalin-like domain-containing protein n=1 Tax=Pedobacter flavus TaxID=3113906 RepID=A0ABU7H2Z9_9SPHI|nr:hypothetical protein [Pedobacter sp. VNH31]MEE1885422.1 hypothetical protein [Pedobacter sp. VNH31]
MKLKIILNITFLIFCFSANAQVKKESIIGKWKLVGLIDKEISENERLKQYHFTNDSLIYYNVKNIVRGKYLLNEKNGNIDWFISNPNQTLTLTVEPQNNGQLYLWMTKGVTTIGILEKVKE